MKKGLQETIKNTQRIMLELNLYRNTMTTSKGYGMIYGRVEKKETYDLAKLAEHMHNHNSPYSSGVILGILKDMVSCIRELCLEGNQVKIADLAIFSLGIKNKCGAATEDEFSIWESQQPSSDFKGVFRPLDKEE